MLIEYKGTKPQLGTGCYIASGAKLIGSVTVGNNCSFWFNCVVRGDGGPIKIGNDCNVQDNVVIHCLRGGSVTIGNRVSIGHSATVHGCTIEDNVLIGIGSTILDGAIVRSGCLIGANAVIPKGMECIAGNLYLGVPAKPKVLDHDLEQMIDITALRYVEYIREYGGDYA